MKFSKLFGAASVSKIGLAAALVAYPTLAFAQEGTSGTVEPESAGSDEIIVTGSRLGRTSFNSPTPINVVGQDRVQDLNITNVGDALNQIPSFRPLTSPSTNSLRAGTNIGGRSLDLRGLGPARTLTLIDGRRNVPSGDENTFDLNAIPSNLVQRSEVVTGGASAAYGADAVAGVVNLILNTKLTGVKGELSYGISELGDARQFYGAFAAGTGFSGGRGHVVIGGEYSKENGTGDFNSRDWSKRYHSFVPNPFFNTNPMLSNGLPANVAIDNVLYVLNPAGLISVVHPLQGMQFDSSGNLVPFQFGELFNRAKPSTLMVGGDPTVRDIYGFNNTPLVVPTRHYALLAHAEYELNDSITASAELSYSMVDGGPTAASTHNDQNGAIRIQRDNAFLNPSVAAMMDAAKVTFLPVSRAHSELGNSTWITRNETWRAFFALDGKTFGDWRWDVYYQYGRTNGRQEGRGLRFGQRWRDAVDAVRAPAGISGIAAGSIICRSTIANPTNGCIPANIMGAGKVSAAAVASVTGDAWQTRRFVQHNVAGNLRGTLFEGWAGPISAAVGVEYRTNSSEGDADPASRARQFTQINSNVLPPLTQKVTEGYAEVNLPLFKDTPLGQKLEVDAAIRRTHYSLSGNATTWKVGALYELNDEYMLRVTRSRDIRAPSPQELNPNTRLTAATLADPKFGIQYVIPALAGGNPNLQLENGNTFTVGAVFKPAWLPRFRLSVDYYDINVTGAIDILTPSLAVQLCRSGSSLPICTIGTDLNGNPDRILQVNTTYQNVAELNARGLELVSTYSVPLAGGDLNFTLNGNYVITLETSLPDGSRQEFSGVTGNSGSVTTIFGVPRWGLDSVIGYEQSNWSVTTQFRYIPKGILNRNWVGPQDEGYSPYLPNSVSDNRIDDRIYVNLNGRVKLTGENNKKIELFGGINNVFNVDPPSNLRFTGNGLYFDPIGRSYKVGIRADW
ncbi:TonB-dependent receptor domain-containing protein [Sphingopyxis flava]|uniref:TonB-dependent Receptor Plug Domain n=1 Tax=Sphingopyxis flava TaxID=1507287 RepID=A0A1T5FN25_9SPHN|nr:TonB-dependent receptor [Sphingopyxis flava]SKB97571.1 TonB-dependent Receptor Plug Domain [Sphingopyxis flava]